MYILPQVRNEAGWPRVGLLALITTLDLHVRFKSQINRCVDHRRFIWLTGYKSLKMARGLPPLLSSLHGGVIAVAPEIVQLTRGAEFVGVPPHG